MSTPEVVEQQQEEIVRLRKELKRIKQEQNNSNINNNHTDIIEENDEDFHEENDKEMQQKQELVAQLEEEISAIRLQLESKQETITLVEEAVNESRESSSALEQEIMTLTSVSRHQRSKKKTGSSSLSDENKEARIHLKRLIEEAVIDREQAEAKIREASQRAHDDQQKFVETREILLRRVQEKVQLMQQQQSFLSSSSLQHQQMERQVQIQSASVDFENPNQPSFEQQLANEKRDILLLLDEEKQRLLDEFHTMRSRLRAKISLLEKNGESKQRQLEEHHQSKHELEAKLLKSRESHKRLFDQFKGRLETQHAQLQRAKSQEEKVKRNLHEKTTECDDLRLRLHASLGGSVPLSTKTPSKKQPQFRGVKEPFR